MNYSLLIINSSLVKAKLVTKTSGNYWSVSENSATNAWRYNAANGNWNNNNKANNTNSVRPVFAFRNNATIKEICFCPFPCVSS